MHYVLIIGVQNMWKILINNITHFFAHKPLNSEFFIFRSVKLILAPATRTTAPTAALTYLKLALASHLHMLRTHALALARAVVKL